MSLNPVHTDLPALEALRRHLDAHEGRISAADAPLAVAVLDEYLASGARMGRGLRSETSRFRPTDDTGALVAYLFVITVDAATHEGREAALAAYASSGQALSEDAARLYETLTSDAFLTAIGRRPIQGNHKGCQP